MSSKDGARRAARRQERDRILALEVPAPDGLNPEERAGFAEGVAAFREAGVTYRFEPDESAVTTSAMRGSCDSQGDEEAP